MKLTNIHGLPKTLENAIERDPYNLGDARISVTGLLRPPRITLLFKKHAPEITSDVTDHIYSLMGRAIHTILERGGDEEHLTEERLFAEVRGWRVSGALDLQKLGGTSVAITDYKSTSAWAVMNEKVEWVEQLNSYAWLARVAKGYTVTKLSICAIIRDWNRHKVDELTYPPAPAMMITIPVWPAEQAAQFIEDRVRLHQSAIAGADMGEPPPPCSDEERWLRPSTWAVRRPKNKRPTKVCKTLKEAEALVTQDPEFVIEQRPGEPKRCTGNFCQVAPWCGQYAHWQKTNT